MEWWQLGNGVNSRLSVCYKLLTGEISTKNIGGPVMIASVSGEHAEQGLSSLIFLIAILSINLWNIKSVAHSNPRWGTLVFLCL